MYTEQTIQDLTNRIGFGTPKEEGFTIVIDEANSVGGSGRVVSSFHALCTIENIFATLPTIGSDDTEIATKFNQVLADFKKAATLEVLPAILDKHQDYVSTDSYDAIITQNIAIFDDCIGYKMAMMILEMMLSSKESNIAERNVKLTAANLKLEIEGFRNDSGILVASGLVQKYNNSIKRAVNKIFPFVVKVNNGNAW